MTQDTIDISDFFIKITDDLIDLFINIGALFTIFLLNKIIFFFYIYFLILLLIVKKNQTIRYTEEEKKKRKSIETLMSNNIELIHGIKEIKLLNAKKLFHQKIAKNIDNWNKRLISTGEVNRFFLFITNNIKNIFRLLLISLSIFLITKEKLTVAIALMAFNYEESIFGLITYTESLLKNIHIFKLSASRIMEILDSEISPKEQFGTGTLKRKSSNALTLQNISFSYNNNNKETIKNLSLKISQNSSFAFVRESGCGKTTIFHLLTKLYDTLKGEIYLYDQNITSLKEEEIKNNITIVSQNPYLFSMSIIDNLRLNKKVDYQTVEKACKIAQIHEEITNLKEGYHTIIQDNGSNLSGGQRQRLVIARALIQNTPIILLDEATSALDNETQRKLQNALQKIKGKTIITIAHRLSTIKNNKQIIVLKKGTIIDIGTHEELLKKSKTYQNLYNSEQKKRKKIVKHFSFFLNLFPYLCKDKFLS